MTFVEQTVQFPIRHIHLPVFQRAHDLGRKPTSHIHVSCVRRGRHNDLPLCICHDDNNLLDASGRLRQHSVQKRFLCIPDVILKRHPVPVGTVSELKHTGSCPDGIFDVRPNILHGVIAENGSDNCSE